MFDDLTAEQERAALTDPCDDHGSHMHHVMCECNDPCSDLDEGGLLEDLL